MPRRTKFFTKQEWTRNTFCDECGRLFEGERECVKRLLKLHRKKVHGIVNEEEYGRPIVMRHGITGEDISNLTAAKKSM